MLKDKKIDKPSCYRSLSCKIDSERISVQYRLSLSDKFVISNQLRYMYYPDNAYQLFKFLPYSFELKSFECSMYSDKYRPIEHELTINGTILMREYVQLENVIKDYNIYKDGFQVHHVIVG